MSARMWTAALAGATLGAAFVIGAPTALHETPNAVPVSAVVPSTPDAPWSVRSADWIAELAPCENEDGPGPCVWEAQTRDNGVGNSFWIGCDQLFHYFDPEVDEMHGGDKGSGYPNAC